MIPYPLLVAGFIAAVAGATWLSRRSVPSARTQDAAFTAWMATGEAQPGWPDRWAWATPMPVPQPPPAPVTPTRRSLPDARQAAVIAAGARALGRALTGPEVALLLQRWEQAGRPDVTAAAPAATVTAQVRK